ncbi:YidC/Oxa1 family membrane protein insertase [Paenibacillus donghaensis]|uniref:YidC/Oxa1 family membrane protein insertase n=1 Tax=Paenibacillus donghaensis TaxID=414771 RepID=UPI001883456F|nr:YidC/Oxa1 family membrane protein insertase [Paenibacillus donghaensis]MBE9913608.1 YidC/Oxa1 family membrane protein insertase [Paenibacillus donghaensis]
MSLFKTRRGRKWILLIAVMLLAVMVLTACGSNSVTYTTEDMKSSGSFWQRNVVYYFSLALDTFAHWFNGAYGLAVLVMVIIVRTLILPLSIKQVRSSKAMQAIQPELAKIKQKYKDNPEKQQQETMRLFQENKVNPMAGCLPLIVQMPVFIALYNSIIHNKYLYEHSFLWLQLGKPDHTFILPVLAAATTFLQTRMMMKMNPSPQQGAMQFMMFVYPVLIFFMSYQFPSALPLYWFLSNLYTIVQNYFLYRNNNSTANVAAVSTVGDGNAKGGKNNGGQSNKGGKNNKANAGKGKKEAKKTK